MAGGSLCAGSNDYPAGGGAGGEEKALLEKWWAHFAPLDGASLAEAAVGVDYPDLCLRFESGHRIETFSHGGPGCWWYYKDRVTGDVFEAGPWGIRYELDRPVGPAPGTSLGSESPPC